MSTLGKYVRKLRRERHLPLRSVAAFTGKSIAYISDIERGKRATSRPSPELLIKFAELFEVPITTLFEQSGFYIDENTDQYKALFKALRNKVKSTLIVERLNNMKEIITELEAATLNVPSARGLVKSLMITMSELESALTKAR